jgi:Tfp pilus assembly protein PilO
MIKALAVVAALAIPPAIYFPTLGAQRDRQIARAETEIADLDRRIEQARAAQRKLAQFHEELQRLNDELAKLRRILPPAMDVDGIRATVEQKAAARGVTLVRFAPRKDQSIDVSLTGGAAAISQFLRDVANASRILDVSYVTLHPDPAGWRADFVMTGYAMP